MPFNIGSRVRNNKTGAVGTLKSYRLVRPVVVRVVLDNGGQELWDIGEVSPEP